MSGRIFLGGGERYPRWHMFEEKREAVMAIEAAVLPLLGCLGALGAIRAQGVCFRQQLIRPISCAANRATHGARRFANPLTLFVLCPRTQSVVQQRISALRGDRRAVARRTQVQAPRQCPLGYVGRDRSAGNSSVGALLRSMAMQAGAQHSQPPTPTGKPVPVIRSGCAWPGRTAS